MLVLKIKPCMSKYMPLNGKTANGSVYLPWNLLDHYYTWITVVILELIHAIKLGLSGKSAFIRSKPIEFRLVVWWLWITKQIAQSRTGDVSFKCQPYQLSMVGYMPTMVITGNGELGFDSGEGAWEMATTSKEGSRRANYPIPARGGSDEK